LEDEFQLNNGYFQGPTVNLPETFCAIIKGNWPQLPEYDPLSKAGLQADYKHI
jgi:hypothetical protein